MPLLLHIKLSRVPEYAGICWWICGRDWLDITNSFPPPGTAPLASECGREVSQLWLGPPWGFLPSLGRTGQGEQPEAATAKAHAPSASVSLSLWQPQHSWTFCTMMEVSISRETVTLSNSLGSPTVSLRCILFIRAATRVSDCLWTYSKSLKKSGAIPNPLSLCGLFFSLWSVAASAFSFWGPGMSWVLSCQSGPSSGTVLRTLPALPRRLTLSAGKCYWLTHFMICPLFPLLSSPSLSLDCSNNTLFSYLSMLLSFCPIFIRIFQLYPLSFHFCPIFNFQEVLFFLWPL